MVGGEICPKIEFSHSSPKKTEKGIKEKKHQYSKGNSKEVQY